MSRRWPLWVTITAASLGILGLAVLYVAGLRLSLESSKPGGDYTPNERDMLYLTVHASVLFVAILVGFVLGRLSSGKGFAWAVSFAFASVAIMAVTIVGSRELACARDVNDLVRHWECSAIAEEQSDEDPQGAG